jgi:glycosyltransferase involved in cell wall biosynthesis
VTVARPDSTTLPLRIALITGVLSEVSGGVSTAVTEMVRRLDEYDDLEVHVVGVLDPAAPEAWRGWGKNVHALRRYGSERFNFAPGLGSVIDRIGPDLLDIHGLWSYASLRNLLHQYVRRSVPYLVTPHGMLDPWSLARSSLRKKAVAALYERAHLRRASCIRATADQEARFCRQFGLHQPIAIIPNGVDVPSLPNNNPTRKDRVVLFLSRIHPKKNLSMLLQAWDLLCADFAEWRVVVAGPDEGGHLETLQALARRLSLPRVDWIGPVYGEEKSVLLAHSDVFVLPSFSENFGLVIAEALAHGTPVITSLEVPWEGLYSRQCGRQVPLDVGALASALRWMMSLPDAERRAMGRRGRDWMLSDFAPEAVAKHLHALYRWVASGGEQPANVRFM